MRFGFLEDILIGVGFLGLFASEAVLIARWLLRTTTRGSGFILLYACVTVAIWFLTFAVLASIIPGR